MRFKGVPRLFVVGLIFDVDKGHILLQRKARPDYMAGLLCGPGGKVEPKEWPIDAIHREIREEAGLEVGSFTLFATLHCTRPAIPYELIYFYWATMPGYELARAALSVNSMTSDEPLIYMSLSDLAQRSDVLPNFRWLTAMALNLAAGVEGPARVFEVYENYEPEYLPKMG